MSVPFLESQGMQRGQRGPAFASPSPDDAAAPGRRSDGTVDAREHRRGPGATLSMSLAFAAGAACFLVAPFPGYVQLVGPVADAITFFVGSVLFTIGGGLQTWLAAPARHASEAGRSAWWVAVIQTVGTLFFNVTTFRALQTTTADAGYDKLVWRPDALGSICFLVSGVIAYRVADRHGWLPARGPAGWWQPAVNLLGCVFFGIAAVAGYLVPSSGSMLNLAAANWTTCAGAACFLACALDGLTRGRRRIDVPV